MKLGKALARLRAPGARTQPDAFEALVLGSWDELWRYAYRLTGNRDEAEDLLSEAMLDGFRSFGQYRGDAPFRRWMFRIMATTHIDMRRRSRRHQAASLDAERVDDEGGTDRWDVADESADPQAIVVNPVVSEHVQRALDALPEEFRTVVVLVDMEGLDYAEASRVLGVPMGTVRSRLHRARLQLRKALARFVETK